MIENNFSGGRAYAQSKLAQVMFNHDLAAEREGTGVVGGSLHPATYMPTGMVLRLGVTPRATIAEGADAPLEAVLTINARSELAHGLKAQRDDGCPWSAGFGEAAADMTAYLYAWHRYRHGGPDGYLWGQYECRVRRTADGWRISRMMLRAAEVKNFHRERMHPLERRP